MASPDPLTGSCHCGKVRYAVHGDIVSVVNCHCVEQGQESIARYAATPKAAKHFCTVCGTPLFNTNPIDYPSLAMIYLGTASAASALAPRINVYSESMLPWAAKVESIKSFGQAAVRGA